MKQLLFLFFAVTLLAGAAPAFAQKPAWQKCKANVLPEGSFTATKGVLRSRYPDSKTPETNSEGAGDLFTVNRERVVRTVNDPTDGSTTERVYVINAKKGFECLHTAKKLTAVRFTVTFTYPDDPEPRERVMEVHLRPGTATIAKIVLSGTEHYQDLENDRKVPVQVVHTFVK